MRAERIRIGSVDAAAAIPDKSRMEPPDRRDEWFWSFDDDPEPGVGEFVTHIAVPVAEAAAIRETLLAIAEDEPRQAAADLRRAADVVLPKPLADAAYNDQTVAVGMPRWLLESALGAVSDEFDKAIRAALSDETTGTT